MAVNAKKFQVSAYNKSWVKRAFDLVIILAGLVLFVPLFLIISLLVFVYSGRPIFFMQKRMGKNGKSFQIVKFRTMKIGSEKLQNRYQKLNEVNGPAFKIKNDPRFTKFGKILSRTGLDELPQLLNVCEGEMSLIGPRPLPVEEARKLSNLEKVRELISPGITSSWITSGAHSLSFRQWMKLDREYVTNASLRVDIMILYRTATIVLRSIYNYLRVL